MRHTLIALCLFVIATSSCKTSTEEPLQIDLKDGTYKGTFQRRNYGTDNIANVTLNFSLNAWTGQSDKAKYPALCNGTYEVKADSVKFVNACFWTAEFDWTLILSGTYAIRQNGNGLQLIKNYPNTDYQDIYTLTKQ